MPVAARKSEIGFKRQTQELGDLRFRKLLSHADWGKLPEAVKRRFSKRLVGGATAIYTGVVKEVRTNRFGRALAQTLRLMGAPLPIFNHVDVPTVVAVTEDVRGGGQVWTRMYANRSGIPQVIHSIKRFRGPTGLEEYIGFGTSMMLRITTCDQGLTFSSVGYRFFGFTLPRWINPGELTVKHLATEGERFRFEMTLRHPLLGELVHQAADYGDAN
jgi:hypothetical protein